MENKIKLNHEYIRIGSSTGEIFIPILETNDIISFSNGAQASKEIFFKSFIEKTNNIDIQEFNSVNNTNIENVQETKKIDLDNDEDLMKIFNTNTTSNDLVNQLDNVVKNNIIKPPSKQSEPSISYDLDIENNKIIQKTEYHNDTVLNPQNNIQELKNNTENTTMKTFDVINEYEKVKLSNKSVKMTLNIEIDLPDPTHIVVIRDMYENNEVDYLEYMVKKFIYDNIISDPETIESIFINEVNKWLNSKVKSKKKISKTKTVLKNKKKEEIKKEEITKGKGKGKGKELNTKSKGKELNTKNVSKKTENVDNIPEKKQQIKRPLI